jgi:hypothetical protein
MDTLVAAVAGLVLGTMVRRFVRNPNHSPRARGIVKILALYIGAAALALLIAGSRLW